MDLVKILSGLKGKVLDATHFDLLKHAYELQDKNISQLKINNTALKESNELLKSKVDENKEEISFLQKETERLNTLHNKVKVAECNENIQLSEQSSKIMSAIIEGDVTNFYHQQMIDVMGKCMSKISIEAALDELTDYGLIQAYSASRDYGLHYHLTPKAKKAITS